MAKRHIVEAPDGTRHVIETPESATPDQIAEFASKQFAPSRAESLGRGVLQGVTFGFGDELYGAAKGAYDKVLGDGDFSGTYARERDAVRAANDRAQEANPGTYLAGEITGGVGLPLGLARTGYGAATAANAGLKARSVAAAKEGAGYGAAYSLGKAEGDIEDQLSQAAQGAALGGAIGGALPAALAAGSSALRTPGQAVRVVNDPQTVAAEKIAEAFARDAGTEGFTRSVGRNPLLGPIDRLRDEAQRAAAAVPAAVAPGARTTAPTSPLMLADVGGENTRNLVRAAVNMPNARAERFQQVLNRRQAMQPRELEKSLGRNLTQGADDFYKAVDDIVEQRAQTSKPLFDRAFQTPTPVTDKLVSVMERPTLVEVSKQVFRRMQDEGIEEATSQNITRYLHRVKMELDDAIGIAKRSEQMGNKPQAGWDTRTLVSLKRDLMDAIDNPDYKKALQSYAGPSALKRAAEDGFEEALKLPPEDIRKALASLSPTERDLWRQGAARAMTDQIRRGNFMRDRTKTIFDTPDMRLRLKEVFPSNKDRGEFLRTVANERRKVATRAAAQGNSTTAKQLTQAQEAGKQARTAADAAAALTGNSGAIMRTLERGANFASGITPAVAAEILDLSMSKAGGRAFGQSSQAIQNAFARAQARMARQGQATNALLPGSGLLSSEFVAPDALPLSGGIGPRYDANGNLLR
jgi:hypothetical protein